LLLAAAAWAQTTPPPFPQLHGVLLERDAQINGGEFSVRGADNEVIRYRFDRNSEVWRGEALISIPQLHPNEEVDIQSDAIPESPLRYARSVHAAITKPAVHLAPHTTRVLAAALPLALPAALPVGLTVDPLFSRGDLTFSGVVSFLHDGRLVLHTRNAGELTILLRKDTRFLAGGDIVPGSDLKANMRVFVRAGKDLFGHTEAYQVMWGGFLQPPVP
jgi:hypothetical protein